MGGVELGSLTLPESLPLAWDPVRWFGFPANKEFAVIRARSNGNPGRVVFGHGTRGK